MVSVAVPASGGAKASVLVYGRDPTVKGSEAYAMGARRSGGRREGGWGHTPSNHGPFYTFEEILYLHPSAHSWQRQWYAHLVV